MMANSNLEEINHILDLITNSETQAVLHRDRSDANNYSMDRLTRDIDQRERKRMSSEERNKIVKEYYEKERLEKEKEYARLKEVAKSKGLDTTIGSLEV